MATLQNSVTHNTTSYLHICGGCSFSLTCTFFFSRFWSPVALVEEAARDAPVVLLAHSMGNRVVQLLLAHAEATRGRPWIDKQ